MFNNHWKIDRIIGFTVTGLGTSLLLILLERITHFARLGWDIDVEMLLLFLLSLLMVTVGIGVASSRKWAKVIFATLLLLFGLGFSGFILIYLPIFENSSNEYMFRVAFAIILLSLVIGISLLIFSEEKEGTNLRDDFLRTDTFNE